MRVINEFIQEQRFQIYCDMDGVLCDFEKQFVNFFKISEDEFKAKYSEDSFWKLITKAGVDYWDTMPWMPDGKDLWYAIKSKNPIILSSPGRMPKAPVGKKKWVKRELGRDVLVILKESAKKKELASESAILIDDREVNIRAWKANKGIGILHTEAKKTIYELQKIGVIK